MGTSRLVYNRTVERLNSLEGPRPHWAVVAKEILSGLPDWSSEIPYQVKKIAVKDACEAFTANKRTAKETGRPFRMRFRSRKDPQQSCFIPSTAIKSSGIYPRVSGRNDRLYSEEVPENPSDARLVYRQGRWYLSVPYQAHVVQGENQARVVSLDPGVRRFLTYFGEDQAGYLGDGCFSRIVRLARQLDDLLSRASKARAKRRRAMKRAANRIRWKIRDLVDELHWKCARFLVDRFDVILLPTFEVSDMVCQAGRKLHNKSVRAMLSLSHYKFKQRLKTKAFEAGKEVVDVCEAYTSKTCSWSGELVEAGSRKTIRGSDGVSMDRDMNGARGIFLRALGDTPAQASPVC